MQKQSAIEFLSSHGWADVRAEYQRVKNQYLQLLSSLARSTEKNKVQIQSLRDLMDAIDILTDVTDGIVRDYNDAHKKATQHKPGTATPKA